jgi:hypothetical protein
MTSNISAEQRLEQITSVYYSRAITNAKYNERAKICREFFEATGRGTTPEYYEMAELFFKVEEWLDAKPRKKGKKLKFKKINKVKRRIFKLKEKAEAYPAQRCHRCLSFGQDCLRHNGTYCPDFRLKRTRAEKEYLHREAYQEFMHSTRHVAKQPKSKLPTLDTYDAGYSELWHYLLRMMHEAKEE